MSFAIFADSGSNLPRRILDSLGIEIIPFTLWMNGEAHVCPVCPDEFDSHAFYEKMRNRVEVKTSLLNSAVFEDAFRPELEAGRDVLYFSLSSGISGTYHSACLAAQELGEEFPQRRVFVVDSLGAGCGTGLLACRAADSRAAGMSAEEAYRAVLTDRDRLCEYFTVDDLMYLKRTGRVKAVVAVAGTMLNIKPLLWGDPAGKISVYGKARGRMKAIEAIAQKYRDKVVEPEKSRVFISHGDCPEDARRLEEAVRKIAVPKELIVVPHEPLTGAHVGPGMLSLFFLGDSR